MLKLNLKKKKIVLPKLLLIISLKNLLSFYKKKKKKMGKNKLDKTKIPKFIKTKTKLQNKFSNLIEKFKTPTCQITIFIISIIWLIILFFMMKKLNNLIQNYEEIELEKRPIEFINFTIFTLNSDLNNFEYQDEKIIKFLERLIRISNNNTHFDTILNFSLKYSIFQTITNSINTRSKTCDIKLISIFINFLSILISKSFGKIQICDPITPLKSLIHCYGDLLISNSTINYFNSLIKTQKNYCNDLIITSIIKYIKNDNILYLTTEIFEFLNLLIFDKHQNNFCNSIDFININNLNKNNQIILSKLIKKLNCNNLPNWYEENEL